MIIELTKAKERAEEGDKLKSAFLNNISHEIRTPFNGILGFLSLLQDDNLAAEERDEYLDLINSSAERLMNTINDIVEISQIQTGQMKLNLSELNILNFGEQLTQIYKPEVEKHGLNFLFSNELHKDNIYLITDGPKLTAILSNLIRNAIKFTKKGFIKVGIRKNENRIEFYVKDTGIGIPQDRLIAIFERFIQADVSTTRKFDGSGLGLSISIAYAQMLGGKITVESVVGEGSLFSLVIPLPASNPDLYSAGMNGASEKPDKKSDTLKILIADDDEQSAMLMEIGVKIFSNNITKVNNGFDAVQLCRDNQDFDLVLMDIKMPGMDGYEAIKEIRRFNSKVIIIVQTAYAMPGDREKAISAGSDDYIAKPVRKELLLDLLRKYFKTKDLS